MNIEKGSRRSSRPRRATRKGGQKRAREKSDEEAAIPDELETKRTSRRVQAKRKAQRRSSSPEMDETGELDGDEKEQKSSEELCAEWNINPVEIHYTQEEFKTLSTYRYFYLTKTGTDGSRRIRQSPIAE